jgi:hypothetical protein
MVKSQADKNDAPTVSRQMVKSQADKNDAPTVSRQMVKSQANKNDAPRGGTTGSLGRALYSLLLLLFPLSSALSAC